MAQKRPASVPCSSPLPSKTAKISDGGALPGLVVPADHQKEPPPPDFSCDGCGTVIPVGTVPDSCAHWNFGVYAPEYDGQPEQARTDFRETGSRLETGLSPQHNIKAMFQDIAQKSYDFRAKVDWDVPGNLKNRVVRVGTACSGTESPVLAMKSIFEELSRLSGERITFQHVFSAEIVPEKQAYIQVNFEPPLLFRDVREFSGWTKENPTATTAYGNKAEVPECDILIAGSSCVDFSHLNRYSVKHVLDGNESKDTFQGVLDYCIVKEPAIFLMENVSPLGGQWKSFQELIQGVAGNSTMPGIGYICDYIKVDSKDYYLPHTRNRGYLIALHKKTFGNNARKMLDDWKQLMKMFERPASSAITHFLLSLDDPRLAAVQLEMLRKRPRDVPWEACRGRHFAARRQENLGNAQPISTHPPEGIEQSFKLRAQREQDLLNIQYLRGAKLDVDFKSKTMITDISQNVDRGSNYNFGISPCITPSGLFWITNQLRTLTGLENMRLQGLEVENLELAMLSNDLLRDMAGNAMSAPLVGAAIITILMACGGELRNRLPVLTPATPSRLLELKSAPAILYQPVEISLYNPPGGSNLIGDWTVFLDVAEAASARCRCEGQFSVSTSQIKVCQDCHHSVCGSCASHPVHAFQLDPQIIRIPPSVFRQAWEAAFPPFLELIINTSLPTWFDGDEHSDFRTVFESALNNTYALAEYHRSRTWKIQYISHDAILELVLDKDLPFWNLTLIPREEWAVNSWMRELCRFPIARCHACDPQSLLPSGSWQVWLSDPNVIEFIIDPGEDASRTKSWRAGMGLPDFLYETIPRKLVLAVNDQTDSRMTGMADAEDNADNIGYLAGVYDHLPNCGTACGMLYKKRTTQGSLFLFFDPCETTPTKEDHFVISKHLPDLFSNRSRNDARVDTNFKKYLVESSKPWVSEIEVLGYWALLGQVHVVASDYAFEAMIPISATNHYITENRFLLVFQQHDCQIFTPIFRLAIGFLPSTLRDHLNHQGASSGQFQRYYGRIIRIAMAKAFDGWQPLGDFHTSDQNSTVALPFCNNCAPPPPSIKFAWDNKRCLVACENADDCDRFETAYKNRSEPLHFQFGGEKELGVTIEANLHTLAHRAIGALGIVEDTKVNISWKVENASDAPLRMTFNRFRIKNNKSDDLAVCPVQMRCKLRKDQLQALYWMIKQETGDGAFFQRQEIEEAILLEIKIRVAVKTSISSSIKGGILADKPSFGKTATSLGLIQAQFEAASETGAGSAQSLEIGSELYKTIVKSFNPNRVSKRLPSVATLIITPDALAKQWMDEITKFYTANALAGARVILIKKTDDLKELSPKELQEASIIVVAWRVLFDEEYTKMLAALATLPKPRTDDPLTLKKWFQQAMRRLPNRPRGYDADTRKELIQLLEKDRAASSMFNVIEKSKRFRGRQAIEKFEARKSGKNESPPEDVPAKLFPILHEFYFNRIIVDEFSILMEQVKTSEAMRGFTSVVNVSGESRWVLSGTPPTSDFDDLKLMANFIGLDLGRADLTPGASREASRKRTQDQLLDSERFLLMQQFKSYQWHLERRNYGQNFLNCFARQNDAPLDDILCHSRFMISQLPTLARAQYENVTQYFHLNEMKMDQRDVDITDKLAKVLYERIGNSKKAEEVVMWYASISPSLESQGIGPLVNFCSMERERKIATLISSVQEAFGLKKLFAQKQWPKKGKWKLVSEPCRIYNQWKQEKAYGAYTDHFIQNTIKIAETFPLNFKSWDHFAMYRQAIDPKTDPMKGAKSVTKKVAEAHDGSEATSVHSITAEIEEEDPREADSEEANPEEVDPNEVNAEDDQEEHPEENYDGPPLSLASSALKTFEIEKMLRPASRGVAVAIRNLQFAKSISEIIDFGKKTAQNPGVTRCCDSNECMGTTLDNLFLLSACGHIACRECLERRKCHSACVGEADCTALILPVNIRPAFLFYTKPVTGYLDESDTAVNPAATPLLDLYKLPVYRKTHPHMGVLLSTIGLDYAAYIKPAKKGKAKKQDLIDEATPQDSNSALVAQSHNDPATAPMTAALSATPLGGELVPFSPKVEQIFSVLDAYPDDKVLLFCQNGATVSEMAAILNREYQRKTNSKVEIAAPVTGERKNAKKEEDYLQAFRPREGEYAIVSRKSKKVSGNQGLRMLVINLSSDVVAGHNLVLANHVIFLNPVFKETQDLYDSVKQQAIARAHRTGQKKTVHVYHLVAVHTIDGDIARSRESELLIETGCEKLVVGSGWDLRGTSNDYTFILED